MRNEILKIWKHCKFGKNGFSRNDENAKYRSRIAKEYNNENIYETNAKKTRIYIQIK